MRLLDRLRDMMKVFTRDLAKDLERIKNQGGGLKNFLRLLNCLKNMMKVLTRELAKSLQKKLKIEAVV